MGLLTLGERRRLFLRTSRPIGNQHWNPILNRIGKPASGTNQPRFIGPQLCLADRTSQPAYHRWIDSRLLRSFRFHGID